MVDTLSLEIIKGEHKIGCQLIRIFFICKKGKRDYF